MSLQKPLSSIERHLQRIKKLSNNEIKYVKRDNVKVVLLERHIDVQKYSVKECQKCIYSNLKVRVANCGHCHEDEVSMFLIKPDGTRYYKFYECLKCDKLLNKTIECMCTFPGKKFVRTIVLVREVEEDLPDDSINVF